MIEREAQLGFSSSTETRPERVEVALRAGGGVWRGRLWKSGGRATALQKFSAGRKVARWVGRRETERAVRGERQSERALRNTKAAASFGCRGLLKLYFVLLDVGDFAVYECDF
jgi:hypothetical protein